MTESKILEIVKNHCTTTIIDGKEVNILKSVNQLSHELKFEYDQSLGNTLLDANNLKK
jgi:hypothetical protein